MAPEIQHEERWAVVGGGILGMTIALRLVRNGKKVLIFDAGPTLGGLTVSHEHSANLSWDAFYHVVSQTDTALISLLEECGIADALEWSDSKTNFFDGEQFHPLNNAIDYLRLPSLNFLTKIRIGLNIVFGSRLSGMSQLDNLSAQEWLTGWSGKSGYENLWRPLLKSKLVDNHQISSAAYIASVMQRFYGARSGSAKTEKFGFIRGGYALVFSTIRQLLESNGVDFYPGTTVESVTHVNDGVQIKTERSLIEVDQCVITTRVANRGKNVPTIKRVSPHCARSDSLPRCGVLVDPAA